MSFLVPFLNQTREHAGTTSVFSRVCFFIAQSLEVGFCWIAKNGIVNDISIFVTI